MAYTYTKYLTNYSWLKALLPQKNITTAKSEYFDSQWYLRAYDDVRQLNLNPWQHYIKHGWREGRNPSIYFNTNDYVFRHPELMNGNLDPITHYETIGASLGEAPSIYFDPQWYSSQLIDDIESSKLFSHYLNVGWRMNLSPSPYFDVNWYLKTNTDVASAGLEPLSHYINFGHKEGRQPNPYFDVSYYIEANSDVAQSGLEPLKHYLLFGRREEGRHPNLYFDTKWYRNRHMSGRSNDEDPLHHYLTIGSKQNLVTSPDFDPEFYLQQSPEISKDDNAFYHFLTVGRDVGRRPNSRAEKPGREGLSSWAKANGYRSSIIKQLADTLDTQLQPRNPEQVIRAAMGRVLGKIDAVSFDIFDTLIERTSGSPESVFHLVGSQAHALGYGSNDFVQRRKEAELKARQKSGSQEVHISQIYSDFRTITGCSAAAASALLEAELQAESSVCVCKPIGKILFDLARKAEKKILILSDIYLPQSIVESILKEAGYDAEFELFVSSQLGATKHYGHLYKYALTKTGLTPDRVLHVGDNAHSDGKMAQLAGLKTLLVPKPNWTAPSHPETFWSTVVKAERDVGAARDELNCNLGCELDSLSSVGAYVLGPILVDFTITLMRKAITGNISKLFFASRDAFYLKEAYEIVRKHVTNLPHAQYFYASRKVCRFATIKTEEEIFSIADVDHYPMSVENFLTSRFMMEKEDLNGSDADLKHTVLSSRNDHILRRALGRYKGAIIKAAASHREAYLSYLGSIGLDKPGSAVVDIGYRGTIQRSLAGLTDTSLSGVYFMTWPEADGLLNDGLRFESFIRRVPDQSDVITRNLQVFELLLSGTHASVAKFSMKEAAPFAHTTKLDTTAHTRHALNAIRSSALSFVEEFCTRYADRLQDMNPDPESSVSLLTDLLRMPPATFAHALRDHIVEDDFGGETRRLITPPDGVLSYSQALEASCWKEGTASVWRGVRTGKIDLESDANQGGADTFDGYVSRPAFR